MESPTLRARFDVESPLWILVFSDFNRSNVEAAGAGGVRFFAFVAGVDLNRSSSSESSCPTTGTVIRSWQPEHFACLPTSWLFHLYDLPQFGHENRDMGGSTFEGGNIYVARTICTSRV